jgi:hypothetical protein
VALIGRLAVWIPWVTSIAVVRRSAVLSRPRISTSIVALATRPWLSRTHAVIRLTPSWRPGTSAPDTSAVPPTPQSSGIAASLSTEVQKFAIPPGAVMRAFRRTSSARRNEEPSAGAVISMAGGAGSEGGGIGESGTVYSRWSIHARCGPLSCPVPWPTFRTTYAIRAPFVGSVTKKGCTIGL